MQSVSGLKKIYTGYLNSLQALFRSQGFTVDFPRCSWTPSADQSTIQFAFEEALFFRDLPWKPGSKNKIDILLKYNEIISLERQDESLKCTVGLTYFSADRTREPTAMAVESLHYDYQVKPDARHAICHAQNTKTVVANKPGQFKRRWSAIDESPLSSRIQCVRVPTPFVNLPSVVFMLAADHMPHDKSKIVMQKSRDISAKFPKLPVGVYKKIADQGYATFASYFDELD